MNGALDSFQIVGFDVVDTFQHKAFSVPNIFGIAIMTSHMHMNGFMFVRKEQENET